MSESKVDPSHALNVTRVQNGYVVETIRNPWMRAVSDGYVHSVADTYVFSNLSDLYDWIKTNFKLA